MFDTLVGWMVVSSLIGLFFAPAMIASRKGKSALGFVLYSVVLWPMALIHALVMAPSAASVQHAARARGEMRPCHACTELILVAARRCKHCGEVVQVRPVIPTRPPKDLSRVKTVARPLISDR